MFQKIIVFLWLTIVVITSILLLFWTWNNNVFDYLAVKNQPLFKTFVYTFFAGVLGGIVYAYRGFYQSVVEPENSPRAFNPRWIFWYLIRPLASGIFGFVIYAFTRAELVAFGLSEKTQDQNNLMFFALAFLAGFGFHDFAEYLIKKVKNLFNKDLKIKP